MAQTVIMLLRITAILFPLFAIASLGFLVGRRLKPDMGEANRLNVEVFVPALIFSALATKDFRLLDYLPLVAATLLAMIGAALLAWAAARLTGVAFKTLVPTVMFNNCGNLGVPLAVLTFGESALAPAIVMLVVSNLLQFTYGAWLFDPKAGWRELWRSPTMLATAAGVVVGVAGIELWPPLLRAVKMVGDISIPLMLFALGVRLASSRIQAIGFGVFGALLRPLLGSVAAWAVLRLVDLPAREQAMLLVFGALPPAVLNFIFAERYQQEPDKVASMVLIGNLAALLTLPLVLAVVL